MINLKKRVGQVMKPGNKATGVTENSLVVYLAIIGLDIVRRFQQVSCSTSFTSGKSMVELSPGNPPQTRHAAFFKCVLF